MPGKNELFARARALLHLNTIPVDMGGMFTIVKVRENLTANAPPPNRNAQDSLSGNFARVAFPPLVDSGVVDPVFPAESTPSAQILERACSANYRRLKIKTKRPKDKKGLFFGVFHLTR